MAKANTAGASVVSMQEGDDGALIRAEMPRGHSVCIAELQLHNTTSSDEDEVGTRRGGRVGRKEHTGEGGGTEPKFRNPDVQKNHPPPPPPCM
jgi:hypothetical protein